MRRATGATLFGFPIFEDDEAPALPLGAVVFGDKETVRIPLDVTRDADGRFVLRVRRQSREESGNLALPATGPDPSEPR